MPDKLHHRVFTRPGSMRKVINSTLDMMDGAEQTSLKEFRTVLTAVLRGFFDSENIKYGDPQLGYAVSELQKYAGRSRKQGALQHRMDRFLGMLESRPHEEQEQTLSEESPPPRPVVIIQLKGMSQKNLEDLIYLGPASYGFRLFRSEARDGFGILVFESDEAHEHFLERFFKENPSVSIPIWQFFS